MGVSARYICIHVPEFAAQALVRARPELTKCAVAVLAGEAPLEEVCSINTYAVRRGVLKNMTKAELELMAGIVVVRRSFPDEEQAREDLLAALSAFTPNLEIQAERGAAFELVLDMQGAELLLGSADWAIGKIEKAIHKLGLKVRLSASHNFHTAMALAPFSKEPSVIAAGREREALHALPIGALPLLSEEAETFALWGVRTVGELASLPEQELAVRLGQRGSHLSLLARGLHPHLLVPEEAELLLADSVSFDDPVDLLDSLLFVLAPMLDRMLERALSHALAIASVKLTLLLDGAGDHVRTIKPALPQSERAPWLKLIHLDLQAHPPCAAVLGITVQAEPGKQSKVQKGMFGRQAPEPMRLDVTLARLAALVGEERVGCARLQDTHARNSFSVERFQAEAVATKRTKQPQRSLPAVQLRRAECYIAVRRCRPPVRLAVRCKGEQPVEFTWLESRYKVVDAFGPWKQSGSWWEADQVWSREEWDVCAIRADGEQLIGVLANDLLAREWLLEGIYD